MHTLRTDMQLAGVKIRKRKKDIKAKYEPEEFRDQLVQELKPVANESAETVGKHLDSLSEKLDYKTYGETLFDVLFTGGMLGTCAPLFCLFRLFCLSARPLSPLPKGPSASLRLLARLLPLTLLSVGLSGLVEPTTAAGGEYKDGESELCPFSVFSAEETPASVKRYAEVFNLLIRRYRCARFRIPHPPFPPEPGTLY